MYVDSLPHTIKSLIDPLFVLVGTFAGLTCGGVLGMDKGMHRLRESLPKDSHLLKIIHENDQLKQHAQETLFSGPSAEQQQQQQQDALLFSDDDVQLEMVQDQLASASTKQLE